MDERLGRIDYYLNIAKATSMRATCTRAQVGAVIVKRDVILSTGYNGAARGIKDCLTLGRCARQENNIPSGERYELCESVHAEVNACLQANYEAMEGSCMYLYFNRGAEETAWSMSEFKNSVPCMMCKRVLKNRRIGLLISESSFNISSGDKISNKVIYDPRKDIYALLTKTHEEALESKWAGSAKVSYLEDTLSKLLGSVPHGST